MKKILFFIGIVIVITILLNIFSPRPIAFLVNRLFKGGIAVKSLNYDDRLGLVKILEDEQYESKFSNNKFDLIKTRDGIKNPTIIWVHGGAFVAGDKMDNREYSVQIASEGFTVINMNYGLGPKEKYPTPIIQLGELYEYLLKNVETYNLNMNEVYLAGDSAGAQIVAQFLNIETNDDYQKKIGVKPVLKNNIEAALLFCGPYDINRFKSSTGNIIVDRFIKNIGWSYLGESDWRESNLLDELSIIENISEDFPKTFLTDGNINSFEEDSIKLGEKLRDKNIYTSEVYYPISEIKLSHEYQFIMDNPYGINTLNKLIEFLKGK